MGLVLITVSNCAKPLQASRYPENRNGPSSIVTVIVICLPKGHLLVLMNSFKRVLAFQIELEFGMLVFKEMGKEEYPEQNLSSQGREPTTN